MKRSFSFVAMLLFLCCAAFAQRYTDKLNRGLVAVPTGSTVGSTSNVVTWRRLADEYFGVTYNLYKNGTRVASNLSTTCYNDAKSAPPTTTYQVAAVVNGVEQEKCTAITPWKQYVYKSEDNRCPTGYIDIDLATVYDRDGNNVTSHYEPNDAEMADLDGDGQLEIIIKRLNTYDAGTDDGNGGTKDMYASGSKEFVVLDAYDVNWQTGAASLMWRIDCGPNMVSLNSTEIDIIAFDWDEDGKAEVVLRGAENMLVLDSDGKTVIHTVGSTSTNTRDLMTSHTNEQYAWTHGGNEYLLYLNGETGALYQQMEYPLKRLDSTMGETSEYDTWGDNYGHRSSKYFFGAPFLDGRHASLFLARGIYTRHKMIAMDLNKSSHQWSERWRWNCTDSDSPWYGNGYHNFVIADVDEDGRDEIVYGSMVIDDNGKGLSTTGYEHGDAQHVGDFDPYRKGLEFFGCLEDKPYCGSNYRNATTGEVYYKYTASDDDGRCLMANFSNDYPGCQGRSVGSGMIASLRNNTTISAYSGDSYIAWSDLNFRIYWDGDLCSEILNSPGTAKEAKVDKPGTGRLFTSSGCNMNNDSKNNPCFQGDIMGDWREEIVVRRGTGLRVYTSGMYTKYSLPCLWYDHQYRQAMVWQMMAYNQPPHTSYFVGEMEGFTQAPPPLTNSGRTEISNGGNITSANTTAVMLCETNNMTVSVGNGASPSTVFVNAPSWVQGKDENGTSASKVKGDGSVGVANLPEITATYYTHTLTGNGFTGGTNLVKQGDGLLVLPDVTEAYTGNTDVWAGSLAFSGTFSNSSVWMNRHTKLFGKPTINHSLTMEYGSAFYPSETGVSDADAASYATATVGTLNMHEGSRMVIQIDPSAGKSDKVNIGTLALRTRSGDAWTDYGPEYLKPVIQIDAKSSLGAMKKYILGTLSTLTVNGAAVEESIETPVTSVELEGAGAGELYFYDGKLVLFFEGASKEAVTLLAEDYEKYDVGDITSTMKTNGWNFRSKNNKNEITIVQGTSPNATRYFDFYYPDGGASRNQSWDFGVASSLNSDNWTLSFSAALNPGLNNSANVFDIIGTNSGNVATENNEVTNPLIRLKATAAASTTYKLTIGATEYDGEYTLASGTWYKFLIQATKINAKNNTATIYVKITSYDGETIVLEKTVEDMNTAAIGSLKGLCWNSPRGSSRLNLDDVILTQDVVSVTISPAGYASFNSDYPLDLDKISGGTAYIVKSGSVSGNAVSLTAQAGKVAANTGLILKTTGGADGTITIPVVATGDDISATNKLIAVTTNDTDVSADAYILGCEDDYTNVGLYKLDAANTLDKGQAYLPANFSNVKALRFVIDDTATGVDAVPVAEAAEEDGVLYNTAGQVVSKDYKGIVIKNGKKFLNK